MLTAPDCAFALVNFALPEVQAYFRELIGTLIRRLDLRWLKWDFNMDPLPHWRHAGDGGLAHLGHVNGLWEFFNWLRDSFPDLVIENCASGGNRLDWALFCRSHLNFANDQYTNPDCIRRILGRMAAFLPSDRLNMIFGPYQRRDYDQSTWQIMLGSRLGISEPLSNWSDRFTAQLAQQLLIDQQSAVARGGDFYRLTPDTAELRAWEGWQLHDPDTGTGILALWRCESPEPALTVRPRGLERESTYVLADLYTGVTDTIAGAALADGLTVSVPPDRAALRAYAPVR